MTSRRWLTVLKNLVRAPPDFNSASPLRQRKAKHKMRLSFIPDPMIPEIGDKVYLEA